MSTQGSVEWKLERLGMITASRFKDVMTEPRSKAAKENGQLSDTAESYLCELVWEIQTGQPHEIYPTAAMRWGTDTEEEARRCYEAVTDVTVIESGFVQFADTNIGCSPDGLVGDDGGIEIKCPFGPVEHTKVRRRNEVPSQYKWQVVGAMLVTGREWWDFVSYDPRMQETEHAIHIIRVQRVENEIKQLEKKLRLFDEMLTKELER